MKKQAKSNTLRASYSAYIFNTHIYRLAWISGVCGVRAGFGGGTWGEDGHSMRLLLAATLEVMDLAEIDWIKEMRQLRYRAQKPVKFLNRF